LAAADAGVLAEHEARLIFDTRVAGRTLPEVADELGLAYETAKKRRWRAEARWAAWWLPDMRPVGGAGTGEGAACPSSGAANRSPRLSGRCGRGWQSTRRGRRRPTAPLEPLRHAGPPCSASSARSIRTAG
jgi:hypothetical protein